MIFVVALWAFRSFDEQIILNAWRTSADSTSATTVSILAAAPMPSCRVYKKCVRNNRCVCGHWSNKKTSARYLFKGSSSKAERTVIFTIYYQYCRPIYYICLLWQFEMVSWLDLITSACTTNHIHTMNTMQLHTKTWRRRINKKCSQVICLLTLLGLRFVFSTTICVAIASDINLFEFFFASLALFQSQFCFSILNCKCKYSKNWTVRHGFQTHTHIHMLCCHIRPVSKMCMKNREKIQSAEWIE